MSRFWLPLALLFVAVPGRAVVVTANPTYLRFQVRRTADDLHHGTVYLAKVRVQRCNGTHVDHVVNASIDPVAGSSVAVAPGDLCGATWYWGSDMYLYGDGGAYTLRYSPDTTSAVFASPPSPVVLTPYTVVQGSASGSLYFDVGFEAEEV